MVSKLRAKSMGVFPLIWEGVVESDVLSFVWSLHFFSPGRPVTSFGL